MPAGSAGSNLEQFSEQKPAQCFALEWFCFAFSLDDFGMSDGKKEPKPAGYWTEERIAEEAKKYKTRGAFKKGSSAYQAAKRRGVLNEVCSHMEPVPQSWTAESIAAEALKYTTRKAFAKGSAGAYNAARRRGRAFMDRVCKHMEPVRQSWTDESIIKVAARCKTLRAFRENFRDAHDAARKRGSAFFQAVTADLERSKHDTSKHRRPAASKQNTTHAPTPTTTQQATA